jgi:membrane fusion protein, multidrug efflux system
MEGTTHPPRAGSRRRIVAGLAAAVAVLATAACGGSGDATPAVGQGAGRPGGGGPGGPGGARMAPVETAVAERGTIARRVTVSGVVEPIRSIGVNSQLAGALLAVNVEEGTRVGVGTVLARMDDRELRAQVEGARTSLEVARSAFERSEQLLARQVITAAEWDRDRAAHAAARSQLDQLRTRLGFATVASPIAGVVTDKLVERGDVVGSQARLFTIADVSTLVVRVPVSELEVGELAPGGVAEVTLDALPGQRLEGRIRRIFPSADPSTRLVPVEVALSGDAARVAKPGFLARVTLPLSTAADALMVPASAIVGENGAQAVFVVEDGKATRRAVVAGMVSEGRVQILSGLEAGDEVVTVGTNGLRDGATVRVVGTGGNREQGTGNSGKPDATAAGGVATIETRGSIAKRSPSFEASARGAGDSLFPVPSSLFPTEAA